MKKLFAKLEKKLKQWIDRFLEKYLPSSATDTEDETGISESSSSSPDAPADNDQLDFCLLDFCWGGFKGKNAELDPDAVIKGLSVKPADNKMTYSWQTKLDGLWGMGHTEAKAVACLFIPEGNKWIGGKFDWISVSRTSRDLKNIKEGYNGWNWSKFASSQKFAFVIVSGDGKKRTNVIAG